MSMPSDLNRQPLDPERLAALRHRAAALLVGQAAQGGARYQAAEALTVLYALASSQTTAPDALALLHELQVHQVELELQAQELRESRTEMESALQHQIELYECQPVGCFSVDHRLVLEELNQSGAALLGLTRQNALGLPLDAFFSPDSANRFRAAMARAADGSGHPCCMVTLLSRQGAELQVLATVGVAPGSTGYLVNLTAPAQALGSTPETR